MKEPLIYERSVSIASVLAMLEKLKNHALKEGDVSVNMEGIDRFDMVTRLMAMLEKTSGELSLKKDHDNVKAKSLVTKKISDIPACLSFIQEMAKMKDMREVRLNLLLSDGTKISTYRFSDAPESHTLYIIGKEEIIDEVSRILGEKKVKVVKEIEEESEEYCVYCGAYKGTKKTCPACGR